MAILGAVNAALALPKSDLPKLPKQQALPEGNGSAVELLKVLLKLTAEKHGVAAKIIASSDDLDMIAAKGMKLTLRRSRAGGAILFGLPR